jgi:hypothetical protein
MGSGLYRPEGQTQEAIFVFTVESLLHEVSASHGGASVDVLNVQNQVLSRSSVWM